MTAESLEENMFESDNPINELNRLLIKYDLTPNQAKVYLYLSKIGIKTASEISKSLKIPRTETYHLLSTLQQKGIIFSVFGKPTKFNAVGIDESIVILVNNEKNKIKELETGKESIIKLWKTIPKYTENKEKLEDNKFQTLQGRNSIFVKLEQMIKESSENILVLGTESDFKKFDHTDFTNLLKKTKSELKILTDYSNKGIHIFEDVPSKKIKKLDDKSREDFCFIIKDNSEVIFFISNSESKDMIAIWTDSKTFVITLRSLFSLIWKKAHHMDESHTESLLGSEITYEHRLREIEQEKNILNYLQKNFNLSENKLEVKMSKNSTIKDRMIKLNHLNVLIIDDNEQITKMLTTFLELKKHKCTVANDGKQGLILIHENKYDVVLLDLAMPEFDGYTVIKALESKDMLKNNKIIVFTASTITQDELNQLVSRGVTSYILKPIDIDLLLSKIIETATS